VHTQFGHWHNVAIDLDQVPHWMPKLCCEVAAACTPAQELFRAYLIVCDFVC